MSKPDWLVNFELDDFRCPCKECAKDPDRPHTKLEVTRAVQKLRNILGSPIVISSGVRCLSRNEAVGGSPGSRHLPKHADAVDIAVADSQEAMSILHVAMLQINPDGTWTWTAFERGPRHVHIDARPGPRLFLSGPM